MSLGRLHPRERQLDATGLLQGSWLSSIREGPGRRVWERELSWEVVVEVRHRGVVGEGRHLVRGDVRGAALLQSAQGPRKRGRRRRGLATHVQARRRTGAELWRRAALERAGVLVKLRSCVVLLVAVHGCRRVSDARSGELGLGSWSCAALPLRPPPLLALTAPLSSPREPAAGGDCRAGRPAIGSAVPHVAQPGTIIGLADCLKKQGPGTREHLHLFQFSLSAEFTAHTCMRSWQCCVKWSIRENIKIYIQL